MLAPAKNSLLNFSRTILIVFLSALFITTIPAAEAPPVFWARSLATENDGLFDAKLLADRAGGFYLGASGKRSLFKFGANRELEWEVRFLPGTSEVIDVSMLDLLENGDLIAVFSTPQSGQPVQLYGQTYAKGGQFLVRLRPDGTPVNVEPISNCYVTALTAAPGGFIVAGFGTGTATIGSQSIDLGAGRVFVSRFSPTLAWTRLGHGAKPMGADQIGKLLWVPETESLLIKATISSAPWTFGETTFTSAGERILQMAATGAGAAELFAGSAPGVRAMGVADGRVTISWANSTAQFDPQGNLIWSASDNGDFLGLAGGANSFGARGRGSRQHWQLMAFDEFGAVKWQLEQPGRAISRSEAVAVLSNGQVVMAGTFGDEGIFLGDQFLGDLDQIGLSFGSLFVAVIDPRDEALPVFRAHPKSQRTAVVGERIELRADVFSPTPVSLQWFKNNEPLPGQTEAALVLSDAQSTDSGTYFVEAINSFGTVRSSSAAVKVNRVTVATLAGNGEPEFVNHADPKQAQFNSPRSVLSLPNGAILVADSTNHVIRKIDEAGVSTFAGSVEGYAGGAPADAKFSVPIDLSARYRPTSDAQILVVDAGNRRVRSISYTFETATARSVSEREIPLPLAEPYQIANTDGLPASLLSEVLAPKIWFYQDGDAAPWAGSDEHGDADGDLATARFGSVSGLAVDLRGNTYVADALNRSLRRIAPEGIVTTIASNIEGIGNIAADENGYVYTSQTSLHRIIKISPNGVVTPIAGAGELGFADGDGATAKFNLPEGLALLPNGNLLVADKSNHRIREIRFEAPSALPFNIAVELGDRLDITVLGDAGARYAIESASSLQPGASWTDEGSTDDFGRLQLDRPTEVRFFRARKID